MLMTFVKLSGCGVKRTFQAKEEYTAHRDPMEEITKMSRETKDLLEPSDVDGSGVTKGHLIGHIANTVEDAGCVKYHCHPNYRLSICQTPCST